MFGTNDEGIGLAFFGKMLYSGPRKGGAGSAGGSL